MLFSNHLTPWCGFTHHSSRLTASTRAWLLLCVSTFDHGTGLLSSQMTFCCIIQSARTLQVPPMTRSFQGLLPGSVLEQQWWRGERDPLCLSHSLRNFTLSKNSYIIHGNITVLLGSKGRYQCHSRFKEYHPSQTWGKCKACTHEMRPSCQSRGETTATIHTGIHAWPGTSAWSL